MRSKSSSFLIIAALILIAFGQQTELKPYALDTETQLISPGEISYKADKVFPKIVFQDADLRAVLQFFAEMGDVNFVLDPAVSGKVNLRLQDVSWETGLMSVLNTFDLIITKEGNTYRVLKLSDYRKQINDARTYDKKQKELLPLETKIIALNYADANSMVSIVQQAMSERGEVIVDSRTNSLIIKDIAESFPKIDSLTLMLDTETPQILVSAKIISVDKTFIQELGVAWGATGSGIQPDEQTVSMDVKSPQPAGGGVIQWGIVSGDYNINAQISAMVTDNNAEIVDNPEIVTLDNQTATLRSGDQVPVSFMDEAGNIITEYYNAGVELTVKPHVTSENRIALMVDVSKNEYTPGSAGQYIIKERQATTNCIVDNHGSLVIGGISTEGVTTANSGVPVLKDLPILGRLFRYDSEDKSNKTLVIYVTPHIIVPESESVDNY